MDRELKRQLFHMIIGIVAIAILVHFGREFLMAATFFVLVVGLFLININITKALSMPPVEWFIKEFERDGARLPGWGSACYAAGALFALTFLSSQWSIVAVLVLLGLGDGVSTIAGRYGKIKLPYNQNKTVEGSLAFFLVGLVNLFIIGPVALPLAFIGAIAEGLPFEDNIVIPVVCTFFLLLF